MPWPADLPHPDDLLEWILDRAKLAPGASADASLACRSWQIWAMRNGRQIGSVSKFGWSMRELGFKPTLHPCSKRPVFVGLRLVDPLCMPLRSPHRAVRIPGAWYRAGR